MPKVHVTFPPDEWKEAEHVVEVIEEEFGVEAVVEYS